MLGHDLLTELESRHEVTGMDIDKIDIVSAVQCREAVDENSPDIVINAAAYTNVDGCEKAKDECFAVNAEAVKNIAEACRGKNICIVHFSTDYVFDGNGTEPYKEDHPCKPINTYGASKLTGELYLQDLAKKYILIRTAWLYGKNGKNFVQTIMEKARTIGRLEVVDDQIGSPTYTKDLASAVSLLIDIKATGVFHITNRGSCNWYQFAVKILQESGITGVDVTPIKSDKLVRDASRPVYSVLSTQKFIQTTGKTMQPWQLALQDYLKNVKR
jgi:dTDP-4-dehydrorhamnose reductase